MYSPTQPSSLCCGKSVPYRLKLVSTLPSGLLALDEQLEHMFGLAN